MGLFDRIGAAFGRGAPAASDDFDAAFYREANPDLAGLKGERALRRHYESFGRMEGRIASAAQALAHRRAALPSEIEQAFGQALGQAHALYRAGERDAADAVLTHAAEAAAARWTELPPPAPKPVEPQGRVVMLANVDLPQCTHYRVAQKVELFARLGRPLEVFRQADWEGFLAVLPGASAAIFYRLAALPANLRAIEAARALDVPTYYDIDDLIFTPDYPEPLETYGGAVSAETYAGLQAGVPLFRAAMARCDYAIASTTALADVMRKLVRTGEAFVLPNGLDSLNAPFLDAPHALRDDGALTIFYGSGTLAHNSDVLELAGPGLVALLQRRPDARLVIAGHLTLDARFDIVRDRIARVAPSDLAAYWARLAEADVNLAVLRPNPVTDAKSEIKWLEAAALGVPSVVSDTRRYREVLTDGEDALIARTPADWAAALERLAADASLRRRLAEAARVKARRDYSLDANAARLEALLAPALARVRPSSF